MVVRREGAKPLPEGAKRGEAPLATIGVGQQFKEFKLTIKNFCVLFITRFSVTINSPRENVQVRLSLKRAGPSRVG